MNEAVAELNELIPAIWLKYSFEQVPEGYQCQLIMSKDQSSFDTYGVGRTRSEAKARASQQMVGLLKILFPLVPLALYRGISSLHMPYTRIERLPPEKVKVVFPLPEIRSAKLYLHIDPEMKAYYVSYYIPDKPITMTPPCPIVLLNDPIRFSDWSLPELIQAQEIYLSNRITNALQIII